MRRAEIDGLVRSAIDWKENQIQIEPTDVLQLKADESAGVVAVDPEMLEELRELLTGGKSDFVVNSYRPPRPGGAVPYLRCQHHFEFLIEWLRSKGIKANKPLHELRKEFGAQITSTHGIYAASRSLRHADISTTDRHYADQKVRVTSGAGPVSQALKTI